MGQHHKIHNAYCGIYGYYYFHLIFCLIHATLCPCIVHIHIYLVGDCVSYLRPLQPRLLLYIPVEKIYNTHLCSPIYIHIYMCFSLGCFFLLCVFLQYCFYDAFVLLFFMSVFIIAARICSKTTMRT